MNATALGRKDAASVRIEWGVKIPLRDGVRLNATLYLPGDETVPGPGLFTLTPYVSDSYHGAGVYFASHGFAFLIVDCRGRGNSEGVFRPNIQERVDGYDIVEWVAQQRWCNGKVAMGGGSYSGYNQWATAQDRPPHLTAIMPRCSAYPGVDFPIRNNIGEQYSLQWLTYVAGKTVQSNLFSDQPYWSELWRTRFVSGKSFRSLPLEMGLDEPNLRQWLDHPELDAYWDAHTPGADDYRQMDLPVLSITGAHDDDQQGALEFYRNAMRHGTPSFRDKHYLIIGPWDHSGVGAPQPNVGGVAFGPDSLLDMRALSVDWYRWTMAGGPKPDFLKDRVAYYVAGAECWRYAPSLDAITARAVPWFLAPGGDATRLATPGKLAPSAPHDAGSDSYLYDPRDVSIADLEVTLPPFDPAETRLIEANDGKQLVYETPPFAEAVEISGFFKFDAWISIDQPDTDFRARVYAIGPDDSSILMTVDTMRARYREGLRTPVLIDSPEPKLYRFDRFWFTSRQLRPGDRLRLVIDPFNSIHTQKNYNSGGLVSDETMVDARPVVVRMLYGGDRASVLHVPYAEI